MFTGLIQDIGIINSIEDNGDWKILIETNLMNLNRADIGASIACNGACMTVIEKGPSWFVVNVSQESLSKTNIGTWKEGARINLERSMKIGDELGGHLVSGHVDITAEILEIKAEGESQRIKVQIPKGYAHYIAPKGSITIDGVSLTVNEVDDEAFGVNIVPHTWENTTLQDRKKGDLVNIEIDMLARYVANMLRTKDAL